MMSGNTVQRYPDPKKLYIMVFWACLEALSIGRLSTAHKGSRYAGNCHLGAWKAEDPTNPKASFTIWLLPYKLGGPLLRD